MTTTNKYIILYLHADRWSWSMFTLSFILSKCYLVFSWFHLPRLSFNFTRKIELAKKSTNCFQFWNFYSLDIFTKWLAKIRKLNIFSKKQSNIFAQCRTTSKRKKSLQRHSFQMPTLASYKKKPSKLIFLFFS